MFSLDGVSRVWGATVAMILKNSVFIISLYFSCSSWLRFTYAVGRVNTEVCLVALENPSQPAVSLLLRKLVHCTNTSRFSSTAVARHSQMVCIDNHSLFFAAAYTVPLSQSLQTVMVGATVSLTKSKAEI